MNTNKKVKVLLIAVAIALLLAFSFLLISRIISCNGEFASAEASQEDIDAIVEEICKQLDNGNTNINISAPSYEAVHAAVEVVYDQPSFFWIARDYQIISVGGIYTVRFSVYYPNHKEMMQEIESRAEVIVGNIPDNSNDYDIVKYIHDELCAGIEYKDNNDEYDHNIYGALVKGECVCEGYAKAFMYLCEKAGINALYFSGTSLKDNVAVAHAWNAAYLDGDLYYFDVTWDDLDKNHISYSSFALNSSEIIKNHTFDEYHPIMEADADKYNYFSYNGYILEEYSKENVAAIVAKQKDVIDIKCTSLVVYNKLVSAIQNPYQLNEILTLAKSDNTGFNSFSYVVDESTYCVRLFFE